MVIKRETSKSTNETVKRSVVAKDLGGGRKGLMRGTQGLWGAVKLFCIIW